MIRFKWHLQILAAVAWGIAGVALSASAPDKYENFAELECAENLGTDYEIKVLQRPSPVLVLAIHGGWIEPGTSELAQAIAGNDHSLYLFEGHKGELTPTLHITSSHFDEPTALSLSRDSEFCVSIHGSKSVDQESVCLGGQNEILRSKIFEALHQSFPEVEMEKSCKEFPALGDSNIVNRCKQAGVQLEISRRLRNRFAEQPELRQQFAAALRRALN